MLIPKSVKDFFSLDIDTSSIKIVQLSSTGPNMWNLLHYGYASVDEKIIASDSVDNKRRLGDVIMTTIGQSGIKTKNVVINMPANKTYTTIVEMPNIPLQELKNTVKYQVDQYVPMAVDNMKYDWALLGQSLHDPKQQEVLISSTAKTYAESQLEFVESLGLNVIAAEPDPLAAIRSLIPANYAGACLIIDMGELDSDIVVSYGDSPRLVRNIPIGLSTLIRSIVQNLNVKPDQARQFILKFGLSKDRLEGQVYRVLELALDSFLVELTKSIKFFQTRYPAIPINDIFLSGFLAAIPQFNEYVSTKTSFKTTAATPWQKVKVPLDSQQKLAMVSDEFAVAVGLAERKNEND